MLSIMGRIVVWLLVIGFAVARFTLPTQGLHLERDGFKDFAHCFIGSLFGGAVTATILDGWKQSTWVWIAFGGLTLVEVVAAIVRG